MFSSWDLIRPRFWYPMSSLEQSMMELEHMSDLMTRSHFPFDLDREMLAAPSNLDDDDFFRDLPMLAREQRPETQHREAAAQPMQMEPNAQTQSQTQTQPKTTSPTQPQPAARDNDPNKTTHSAETKQQQQQQQHSANPLAQMDNADNQYRRAFSSYSFSDSSIVDDKGRRVTSTRRRYEDSTGRLKAVHERQIEGKKLRTTWNRMDPGDEGQHDSVCSSGSPEEFEALWQQTPFGEAQKKTIKEQQQQQLEQSQQESSSTSESNSKDATAGAEVNKVMEEPTPMEE